MMKHAVSVELPHEIENFLYRESSLLEDDRFEDWLACLSSDVRYWMPVRERVGIRGGELAPSQEVFALFEDDKKSLEVRVLRIRSGQAHAEIPPSVTQRYLTNIMAEPVAGAVQESFAVRSSFQIYQEHRGLHGVNFYGRRSDVLRRTAEGSFEIAERKIELAQAILPSTLSIFF